MTKISHTPAMKGVYLIHAENGKHYVGYADDVDARLTEHEQTICYPPTPEEIQDAQERGDKAAWSHKGPGAHYMGVLNYKKIAWKLARVWWGKDRTFERRCKRWGRSSQFCPECLGQVAYNRLKGDE